MGIHQIKHFCPDCGREMTRFEIPEGICQKCKCDKLAKKIEDAVGSLKKLLGEEKK
jgi:ribosomal protein L37AE/L43A